MLGFIKDNNCTGCTACKSICPKHCIEMKRLKDGFLYPFTDASKCIHCGLCERVCPQYNDVSMIQMISQEAYAAIIKDKNIWKRSASGGAFTGVCRAWNNKTPTHYVGAVWADGFYVKHVCVEDLLDIDRFRKSKYISSDMNSVFEQIKYYLENNERVLFSGTPCQAAGLRMYLKKDYCNLLIVDLICHGVGSQYVFNESIKLLEEQIGGVIVSYDFRAKRNTYETDYLSRVKYISEGITKEIYLENDRFSQLYLNQLCLRNSCGGNCKYRSSNRQGDITIADFKGLSNVFPQFKGSKVNYSTIVVNTQKGKDLLPKLKEEMYLYSCDLTDVEKYNPLFSHQTWFCKERDSFFEEFNNNPRKTIEEITSPAVVSKLSLKRRIYSLLPVFIRRKL